MKKLFSDQTHWIINIAAGSIIYPNKAIIRVKQINGTLSSLSQITGLVAKKATSLSQSTYLLLYFGERTLCA